MNNSKYSSVREPGREHIPLYPKGFIAIRIVQLVLSLIVIGLSAYGVALWAFDGDIFVMVVAIMTLITSIWILVAEFGAPNVYNYWAVMSTDILMLIMWLASMGLLASEVNSLMSVTTTCDYYYGVCDTYGGLRGPWISCLAGACGVAGVEFVLYIVSLSIHSVMMHRHRAAGLHCNPMTGAAAGQGPAGDVKPQINYQPVPPQPQAQMPMPMPMPMQAQAPMQPQMQPQQQPQPIYPPQTVTPQQVQNPYGLPVQQPQPYYPQQTPPPLVAQQTGQSYVQQQQQPYPHPQQPELPQQGYQVAQPGQFHQQ